MAARKPNRSRGGGKPAGRRPRADKTPRRAASRGRTARRGAVRVTAVPTDIEHDGKMRLNRFLASAGVCSRRAADELIARGRITINGKLVKELGTRVDPENDEICLDHQRVMREAPVYVLFNKPKDVVCTNARDEVRKRAIDFLAHVRGRIYTVGRLDTESEGLILLTNDGDFANTVAHPRFGVPKTYAVLVRGRVDAATVQKARGGVWLSEGKTGGADIRVERRSRDRTYLKMVLREGKNREIRRVFAKLGHNVLSLKRVRIGPLSLHGLRPGAHRFLRPEEVRDLLAGGKEAS